MTSNQAPHRRRLRAATLAIAACIAGAALIAAGCGGTDTAQRAVSTAGVDRQAATYRGTKVTVVNASSSPVQASVVPQGSATKMTTLGPGGTTTGAADGGNLNGGTATTNLSWDEDVVTRELVLITHNTVTRNGLRVWSNVMDTNGEFDFTPVPVREPAAYDGETTFEWDGHRIRVDRQGWDRYFYLWEITVER